MKYTKIFSDVKGETHFKEVKIELGSVEYAPPAPAFMVSLFRPAAQFAFKLFPSKLNIF